MKLLSWKWDLCRAGCVQMDVQSPSILKVQRVARCSITLLAAISRSVSMARSCMRGRRRLVAIDRSAWFQTMLDEPALRRMFEVAVQRSRAFGAQLSIGNGSEQIDLAAGLANAERGIAMTADTLMQIGSITKVFNAVILTSLAEDNVVDLDA